MSHRTVIGWRTTKTSRLGKATKPTQLLQPSFLWPPASPMRSLLPDRLWFCSWGPSRPPRSLPPYRWPACPWKQISRRHQCYFCDITTTSNTNTTPLLSTYIVSALKRFVHQIPTIALLLCLFPNCTGWNTRRWRFCVPEKCLLLLYYVNVCDSPSIFWLWREFFNFHPLQEARECGLRLVFDVVVTSQK